MERHGIAFLSALICSLGVVPLIGTLAKHLGVVDKPDARFKKHEQAVPYMGGMAVFVALCLGFVVSKAFDKSTLGVLVGGAIVLLVGLVDDIRGLTPKEKLCGQLLASIVVVAFGIRMDLPFVPLWVDIAVTLLWLVGVTNAFNIVDILDGLAGGLGLIACLVIALMASAQGLIGLAAFTMALAGGLSGFLPYNFPKAKIYLGDAGSLFIGLTLGSLALLVSSNGTKVPIFLGAMVALGVPLFDTFFVIWQRWRSGRSIFLGSNDHFALRLVHCGLSRRTAVMVIYGIAMALAGFSVTLVQTESPFLFYMIIAALLSTGLVIAKRLGRIDMSTYG